jgi:acyl carrier protein
MEEQLTLEELSTLIVEALKLEDVTPDDIDPDGPLFGEGLGLDSIDALELALAISQRYGVTISSEDPNVGNIFGSVRSLAAYIDSRRAG